MRRKKTFLVCILGMAGLMTIFFAADVFFRGASWWPFHHEKHPKLVTAQSLRTLYHELHLFSKETGQYPQDLEELTAWLKLPSNDNTRKKRYVDAWGRPVKYVVNNARLNPGEFDLYSVGANGVDEYYEIDFGDDIHVYGLGMIRWPTKKR